MNLDELLATQESSGQTATIEAVMDKPTHVKVTPWVEGRGCLCHLAIVIPKKAVKKVIPTGQKHPCCGKVLSVVEVVFDDGATIAVQDLYEQQLAKLRDDHSHGAPLPFEYGEGSMPVTSPTFGPSPDQELMTYDGMATSSGHTDPWQISASTSMCGGRPCPPGYVCIGCGGQFHCVPQGSSCCGGRPCPPGYVCIGCGGQFHCVPQGSSCCGSRPCRPGYVCIGCGGQFHCVPRGSSCCGGRPCPPGYVCIGCGGQFHCVRRNCRCEFGRIVC
jgi:hypothetical protein